MIESLEKSRGLTGSHTKPRVTPSEFGILYIVGMGSDSRARGLDGRKEGYQKACVFWAAVEGFNSNRHERNGARIMRPVWLEANPNFEMLMLRRSLLYSRGIAQARVVEASSTSTCKQEPATQRQPLLNLTCA